MVTDSKSATYKIETAVKLGIPVVGIQYIKDCCESEKLVDSDGFIVAGKTKSDSLASGKIPIKRSKVETAPKQSSSPFANKTKVNLKDIKVWPIGDPQAPPFHEDSFKIAKSCILFKEETNLQRSLFIVIELHVYVPTNIGNNNNKKKIK